MATIRKRHNRYQAQVRIGLVSRSASFSTRAEARAWAAGIEAILLAEMKAHRAYSPKNIAEIMHRYLASITPSKKTAKDETIVINAMLKESWMTIPLKDLKAAHLTEYRDRRLQIIKPSSFNRQFGIIFHACRISKNEWSWVFNTEFLKIRKAKVPPPSSVRRISRENVQRLLEATDHCANAYMKQVLILALETGLRRSELCTLERSNIDFVNGVIHLTCSKNGYPRTIPLTNKAISAVKKLVEMSDHKNLVQMSPNAIRLSFARLRSRAGLDHVRFHDLRHEAVSRFFEMGLTPPEVASISGHRTLSQLMRYSHAMSDKVARVLRSQ